MSFGLSRGIMEYWNDGIVALQRIESILDFIVPPLADQLPNIAVPQDPFFQYSSIPPFQSHDLEALDRLGRNPKLFKLHDA